MTPLAPAGAQKSGGTLRVYFFDSPASMSIHEESSLTCREVRSRRRFPRPSSNRLICRLSVDWRRSSESAARVKLPRSAMLERLGPRVIDSEIFVKATQDPMTNGAAVSRPIPRKDEIERHASGERAIQLLGLHKLRQSAQCGGLLLERVAERAAQSDVALDLLGQYLCEGAHDAPPGKGSATSVSCGTATFTYMAVVSMLR